MTPFFIAIVLLFLSFAWHSSLQVKLWRVQFSLDSHVIFTRAFKVSQRRRVAKAKLRQNPPLHSIQAATSCIRPLKTHLLKGDNKSKPSLDSSPHWRLSQVDNTRFNLRHHHRQGKKTLHPLVSNMLVLRLRQHHLPVWQIQSASQLIRW